MAQQSALRVELVAPAAVRAGEPVLVTIRITNPSDKPVDAYFVGREIAFDIVVRKAVPPSAHPGAPPRGQPPAAHSAVVWRRLYGLNIQPVLQVRSLAPGETLELRDTWRQQSDAGPVVPAGSYLVEGVVLGQDKGELRTQRHSLVIGP